MNAARLLEYFDRIAEAPDAVSRLRKFILDLAVRGKLVEQDPSDEPASELLKKIGFEKQRLMANGSIKKVRHFSISHEDELFSIPSTWRWVCLSDLLVKLTDGTHRSPDNFEVGDFKYVTAKNIKAEGICLDNITYVSKDVHQSIFSRCNPKMGDILYVKDGATTGVVTINDLDEPFSMLSSVALLRPSQNIYNKLLLVFLRSPFFYNQMRGEMKGAAITRVTLSRMEPVQVPLPPLAEQHRIVAKVDELMALCDRLEASQAKRESRRDRLASASLKRIGQPEDVGNGGEFSENVRFHLHHLPRLATRPEHVKELRQTILNLAVRGKLVPQDPNDEPASELLKKIQVKRRHAGYKKRGRGVCLETVAESFDKSKGFPVPSSWTWAKLGDVSESRLGKMLDKAKNKGTPRRYLRNINVRWFDFDLQDVYEMNFEDSELQEFSLSVGDVLICEGGEPGRCAIWDGREEGIYFQKAIHRVRFFGLIEPEFFARSLANDATSGRLHQYFTGVGIKHLTGKGLSEYAFPLPPLAEQHRIVAKVDELMNLCDKLEVQLSTNQTNQSRLLEATLCDALGVTCLPVSRPSRPVPSLKRVVAAHSEQPSKPITPRPGPVETPPAAVQGSLIGRPTPQAGKPRAANGDIPGAILAQMQPGQEYSRAQLAETLGLSVYEWNMAIRELKESGRVVQTGERRGARYRSN